MIQSAIFFWREREKVTLFRQLILSKQLKLFLLVTLATMWDKHCHQYWGPVSNVDFLSLFFREYQALVYYDQPLWWDCLRQTDRQTKKKRVIFLRNRVVFGDPWSNVCPFDLFIAPVRKVPMKWLNRHPVKLVSRGSCIRATDSLPI